MNEFWCFTVSLLPVKSELLNISTCLSPVIFEAEMAWVFIVFVFCFLFSGKEVAWETV